jgi:HIV-1 Vpr-binding protein
VRVEATDLKLYRAGVAARTKIDYSRPELLLLIQHHLLDAGLSDTAATLEAELRKEAHAKLRWNASAHHVGDPFRSLAGSAATSGGTTPASPSDVPSDKMKTPLRLRTRSHSPAMLLFTSHVGGSHRSSSLISPHSPTHSPVASPTPLRGDRAGPQGLATTLDSIVHAYLQAQHQACSHPITTLPSLSLLKPHSCPVPSSVRTPLRTMPGLLVDRERIASFGAGRRVVRSMIFSRFYPRKRIHDAPGAARSHRCSAFVDGRFELPTDESGAGGGEAVGALLIGDTGGDLRLHAIGRHDTEISRWSIHDGAISSIVPSANSKLVLTAAAEQRHAEVKLWRLNEMDRALHTFDQCRAALWSHSQTHIVATGSAKTFLIDAETGANLVTFEERGTHNPGEFKFNVACFSANDDFILSDAVLWDRRVATTYIHKFDKLSAYGQGVFSPTAYEVVIGPAVWDLRTFKLLRRCGELANSMLTFNPTRDVLYAVGPNGDERPGRRAISTSFVTVDTYDFSLIHRNDVGRPIVSLAVAKTDDMISLVEKAAPHQHNQPDCCRLYEVGRRVPIAGDDSDEPLEGSSDDDDSDGDEAQLAHDDVLRNIVRGMNEAYAVPGGADGDSAADEDEDQDEGLSRNGASVGAGGVFDLATDSAESRGSVASHENGSSNSSDSDSEPSNGGSENGDDSDLDAGDDDDGDSDEMYDSPGPGLSPTDSDIIEMYDMMHY